LIDALTENRRFIATLKHVLQGKRALCDDSGMAGGGSKKKRPPPQGKREARLVRRQRNGGRRDRKSAPPSEVKRGTTSSWAQPPLEKADRWQLDSKCHKTVIYKSAVKPDGCTAGDTYPPLSSGAAGRPISGETWYD